MIVLIPLFDKAVYPWFERRGRKLTPLQKSGSGLVVAVCSMLTAAALEHWRLAEARKGNLLPPGDSGRPQAVRLSVFWQAPQYLLVGCSEVLTSVSQLEFFYDQSPESMRSCSMALQLLSTALGGFTASALMQLVAYLTQGNEWISPQDLNQGRLDLFFLLLAGLMALDFVAFLLVANRFQYRRPARFGVHRSISSAVMVR